MWMLVDADCYREGDSPNPAEPAAVWRRRGPFTPLAPTAVGGVYCREPIGELRLSFDARRSRPSIFLLPRRSKVVVLFPTRAVARGGPNMFYTTNNDRIEETIRTVVSTAKSGGVGGDATSFLAGSIGNFWSICRREALFGGQ